MLDINNERYGAKLKVGDLVTAKSYAGILRIRWFDDLGHMFKSPQWMCCSIKHDTSFGVYSESDLQLATEEEIKEYLND